MLKLIVSYKKLLLMLLLFGLFLIDIHVLIVKREIVCLPDSNEDMSYFRDTMVYISKSNE